jgi:hypothetical protein
MFNAFLEPCSRSGIRSNVDRVVTAVVLFRTIPLSSPEVTDYSIRRQLVARLTSDGRAAQSEIYGMVKTTRGFPGASQTSSIAESGTVFVAI